MCLAPARHQARWAPETGRLVPWRPRPCRKGDAADGALPAWGASREQGATAWPAVALDNGERHSVPDLPDVEDVTTPLGCLRTFGRKSVTSVVDWPLDGLVEVEVRPLDARRLFSADKTYLLVGLSGQMGQSLCEWMASNGAGCVCLASRSPKVDERWLASFRGTGTTVKVFAMDVLDRRQLGRVVEGIRGSCPPLAGVANGAMVLQNQLFANMSAETIQRVLAPKVDGSKNLDDVFRDDDVDFFVLLSSVACVMGNTSQSAYTAANGYIHGLVRQRRRRGLAASARASDARMRRAGRSRTTPRGTRWRPCRSWTLAKPWPRPLWPATSTRGTRAPCRAPW